MGLMSESCSGNYSVVIITRDPHKRKDIAEQIFELGNIRLASFCFDEIESVCTVESSGNEHTHPPFSSCCLSPSMDRFSYSLWNQCSLIVCTHLQRGNIICSKLCCRKILLISTISFNSPIHEFTAEVVRKV
ncbi:hypothetical protein H5410_008372 [Solanum commersonii]|uniref:Uncharacterized protein n=1 Tax=Solanum commersonii TaxID=4109 RepID=A0A9J6AGD7_SOLCO|nr:hypothetical protein H5410_008372 [Solanum commersonii]